MEYMLTYSRDDFEAGRLTSKDVMTLISKHKSKVVGPYQRNMNYYLGKQEISVLEDAKKKTPITVCNHAKDIADTAAGYFMGNPITYRLVGHEDDSDGGTAAKAAFGKLIDALDYASTDDDDQENALMLAISGKSFEYIYAGDEAGEVMLHEESLDPANTFLVHDQEIGHKVLFGVYYYFRKDDVKDGATKSDKNCYFIVMTAEELRYYKVHGEEETQPYKVEKHHFGRVPLVEYKNNKFAIGDFEQQIGLIDAYNSMTSDRVKDKEQFIDSILVIYGAIMGDTEEEADEAMRSLQKKKLLELDTDAKAEYLTRTLDETGMETLRQALKEDIYTFSHVPNLTDKNFAGNSSGVAMEYKLLGLEMLTKIKERWYRRGLRDRLAVFLNFLKIKGTVIRESDIEITFSRSLPKNLLELSQIVGNLSEDVSKKTLVGLLPFVEDPESEIAALTAEKEEAEDKQRAAYKTLMEANTTPEEELGGDGVNAE